MREFKIESEDWTFEGWPGVVPGEVDADTGEAVGEPSATVTVRLSRWDTEDEFKLRALMFEPEARALAQGILDCLPTPAPSEEVPSKRLVDSFDLARQAVAKWGPVAQERMVTEEIGEFLSAFAQYSRGRVTPNEVASEIADVILVLASAMGVVGTTPDAVVAEIAAKSARLRGRLAPPEPPESAQPEVFLDVVMRHLGAPQHSSDSQPRPYWRTILPRKATTDAPSTTEPIPAGAGTPGSTIVVGAGGLPRWKEADGLPVVVVGHDGALGWEAPAAEPVPDTDAIIAGTPTVGASYDDCDHTRIPAGTVALSSAGTIYVCDYERFERHPDKRMRWAIAYVSAEGHWRSPMPGDTCPPDNAILIHIGAGVFPADVVAGILPTDYAEVRRIVEVWDASHPKAPATTPIIVLDDVEHL